MCEGPARRALRSIEPHRLDDCPQCLRKSILGLGQPAPSLVHPAAKGVARHAMPGVGAGGNLRMRLGAVCLRLIEIGGWIRQFLQRPAFHLHLASGNLGELLRWLLSARDIFPG